jgi:hypothetical protein
MPELPLCRGEYLWSQSEPVQAAVIAVLHLPHRCSIAASAGQDQRRQSVTLALAQSATGLGHLTLSDLEHHGGTDETALTHDLLYLLMNTTVALLKHHCHRQVSLGGSVPCALLSDAHAIVIPWELWGFQPLALTDAGTRRRVLARVRNLKIARVPAPTGYVPTGLSQEAMGWTPA